MYQDFTIEHAAEELIESELIANSDITIIITDNNGKIISTSEPVTKEMQKHLNCKTKHVPKNGLIVDGNWKNQNSSQQ